MVIYKITDLETGLIYIGSKLKDHNNYYGSGIIIRQVILYRLKKHCASLGIEFQEKDFTKYKRKFIQLYFKKEILENCKSKDEMYQREIYWIKKLDSTNRNIGYNLANGGQGGKTMSKETHWNYGGKLSKEHKDKIAESLRSYGNPMFGKHHSEETKQKMRDNKKNKYIGAGNPMFGKHHSEETKQKMRALKIGKRVSNSYKKKLQESN